MYTRPMFSRVLVVGATGTIGRAVVRQLIDEGFPVTLLVRRASEEAARAMFPEGITILPTEFDDEDWFERLGLGGARQDAVISCLASRTGDPEDAWAVDYRANSLLLKTAVRVGVRRFVLLSAICVQKPLLAFQQAKLAFEAELQAAPITWSIVRPTAFFKSLSGQVERVRRGKPYLVFGDGRLTACKPLSDRALAEFLVDCVDDPTRWRRIHVVGGPGPALTPRQQGELLFTLMDKPPRFKEIPVSLLDRIIRVLTVLGKVLPPLARKAELVRIARYYATESMLALDPRTGQYSAEATPWIRSETLGDHYMRLIRGGDRAQLGVHAVFDRKAR